MEIGSIIENLFQSTPPARGATNTDKKERLISDISIHAPREGGDLGLVRKAESMRRFQSTPPARGATWTARPTTTLICYFNPRPPRGGRLYKLAGFNTQKDFNPRPPRGGRRVYHNLAPLTPGFQSTPPARGATEDWTDSAHSEGISIHAPREGGDLQSGQFQQ